MTFSIVARDPMTGELGVAVQSAMFGAGRVVPWASAGVGAVATQAYAEIAFASAVLTHLDRGMSAPDALAAVVDGDDVSAQRQLGVVDAVGGAAAHTGSATIAVAGHITGEGWSVQANTMARPGVPEAMADAFVNGSGDLAARLLGALDAAQAAGGDLRGQQGAGLIVVAGERAERAGHGVVVDVRVDDHPLPLQELRRLTELARAYRRLGDAFDALAAGDSAGALAASDDRDAVRAVLEFALVRIHARLRAGDVREARREVASFRGDRDRLRAYLTRATVLFDGPEPTVIDQLFA